MSNIVMALCSYGLYSYGLQVCPITSELMHDAVICTDGHTYERSAIEAWLELHITSPRTNLELESKVLIPNHQIRSLCQERRARLEKHRQTCAATDPTAEGQPTEEPAGRSQVPIPTWAIPIWGHNHSPNRRYPPGKARKGRASRGCLSLPLKLANSPKIAAPPALPAARVVKVPAG